MPYPEDENEVYVDPDGQEYPPMSSGPVLIVLFFVVVVVIFVGASWVI